VGFFFRRTFRIVITSSEAERRRWLRDVEDIIAEYFPRLGSPDAAVGKDGPWCR
jgi:hypothetical protein